MIPQASTDVLKPTPLRARGLITAAFNPFPATCSVLGHFNLGRGCRNKWALRPSGRTSRCVQRFRIRPRLSPGRTSHSIYQTETLPVSATISLLGKQGFMRPLLGCNQIPHRQHMLGWGKRVRPYRSRRTPTSILRNLRRLTQPKGMT